VGLRHQEDGDPGPPQRGLDPGPKEGIYFGQCSQICGNAHSYMPIAVRVVSKADFDKWVADKKKAAGLLPASSVASANPPANR
jgi:cytochrome c oxidase subunit 2